VTTLALPGDRGVGHQWSYLPDVARTVAALLAKRHELAPLPLSMAGHWDADGTQMAAAICRVIEARGGARPRVRPFPWWLVYLAAPFMVTLREMLEMRYLWRQPVRMDNARLMTVLGSEPHTPLDEAVAATLASMGSCRRAQAAANHYLREQVRIFTSPAALAGRFFHVCTKPTDKVRTSAPSYGAKYGLTSVWFFAQIKTHKNQ
jgi:hypothetical protein